MSTELKHTRHERYHAVFNLLHDENENVIARFEDSPRMGTDGFKEAERAAACHNTLAGIADPAAALRKAREALEWASSRVRRDKVGLTPIEEALRLLTPEK